MQQVENVLQGLAFGPVLYHHDHTGPTWSEWRQHPLNSHATRPNYAQELRHSWLKSALVDDAFLAEKWKFTRFACKTRVDLIGMMQYE